MIQPATIVLYASDLGLKPGQWPYVVTHDNRRWTYARRIRGTGGDVAAFVYRDSSGAELHVLND